MTQQDGPVFVTLQVHRRFRGVGPNGEVSYHQVLQEPSELLPFFVLREETSGRIIVIPKNEIVYTGEDTTPSSSS